MDFIIGSLMGGAVERGGLPNCELHVKVHLPPIAPCKALWLGEFSVLKLGVPRAVFAKVIQISSKKGLSNSLGFRRFYNVFK